MSHRRTKIIFTVGPATDSPEMLLRLIRAGADICRINMAHASHEWTRNVIRRVRAASREAGRDIGVLLDVKGPEIRTGDLPHPVELRPGSVFDFTVRPGAKGAVQNEEIRSVDVNYRDLVNDIEVGDTVLVDNGLIRLEVLEKDKIRIRCRVLTPGRLGSRRHINLPGVKVNLPALTEKDLEDVAVGIAEGIDFVALSFVREAADIAKLRDVLTQNESRARIIAKIEDQQAVDNLEAIVAASDGLMVARGDLGIECPIEQLPGIQRRAVRCALATGKPVIVATHMLESMIQSPLPTRAEVTDVANAVYELVDAVMLSGETSVGQYPAECVQMLDRIARQIEGETGDTLQTGMELQSDKARILRAAAALACEVQGASLVVFTRYGFMAQGLAALRPNAPIYAFTASPVVKRQLRLHWGVEPILLEFSDDPEGTVQEAIRMLVERGHVRTGDKLVVISFILARDRLVDTVQLRVVA